MLQLCATVLNQADERSVSFISFLTSITGTVLAAAFDKQAIQRG
jgi:hypothetical protein